MITIHPYISFGGNAAEAMRFYTTCLGGELEIQVVGESPMADQWPAEAQQQVLHASITKNGAVLLLGSDMPGPDGKPAVSGTDMTISLTGSTKAELQDYFNALSEGGTVRAPLHDFYSGTIGALTDKYGKNWMFYCAG